ncbi:MAG: 1-(5-phosphoribosyl)-5-[(5-phosphoribosylamino)methylideneamino]imidazole-4-carboxamide isomerase [Clostridiales bacterium]|nr:1-(5-phosphoribosyl)-5-[(5-phosphoribosylamino)methylideneamino]imidazole-4-carboxamide isomerase [Clostridiales bacterium]
MIVIPSIDLKDGKCVRLRKGDFETVHKVAEDPVHTAKNYEAEGAQLLHIVDLDGALNGKGINGDIIQSIAYRTGLMIQLGGGLRNMDSLKWADSIGVNRMVIGSAAAEDPDFAAKAVEVFGDRIVVGIDAKDGIVRTSGWTKSSGMDYLEFARRISETGVKYIIYTDIDTDGMLSGPSIGNLKALQNAVDCEIIASGGISGIEDLIELKHLGVYGAIIGKALYAGLIDLKEAIDKCR